MRLSEVARIVGGVISGGDDDVEIIGIAPIQKAGAGDITFADSDSNLSRMQDIKASAILVRDDSALSIEMPSIRVKNPRVAFAQLLPQFYPEREYTPGIHPTAVVSAQAQVHPSCHIGPWCIVEDGVVIGENSVLTSGIHMGPGSALGTHCLLYPKVTIYHATQVGNHVRIHSGAVLGSDGFGFVFDKDHHRKILQIGHVVIEDNVEIGANVTIDRGTMGETRIGQGTKIDNLVQIGHNVEIGPHSIIVAQAGIAGSTRIGSFAVIAGQAGISGHLKIGHGVTIGPQSGVTSDLEDGAKVMGSPAFNHLQYKRASILFQKLPEFARNFRQGKS